MKRHIDPCHAPNLMTPHSGTIYDHIAGNMAALAIFGNPIHTSDAQSSARDRSDFHAFPNNGSALTCTFGKRQRDIGWIALTILVKVNSRLDPI